MRGGAALSAPETDTAILARAEHQLLGALGARAIVRETAAFRIHLWPTPDPFYRNVAVPVRRPASWASAIAAMTDVFAAAGREARLELFAERWPDLPEALEAAGFRLESRAPVLALPSSEAPRPPEPGVTLLGPGYDTALLRRCLAAQDRAFGASLALDERELEELAAALAEGRTIAAAVLEAGEPVAGGSLLGIGPVAELAGIWTAPTHRRRGYARRVCVALLARFRVLDGELVWLSAPTAEGERLYRAVGFRRVGTQLNYAGG